MQDRELEAAVQRLFALPLRERLRAFELLAEDLGDQALGIEIAAAREARARAEAKAALDQAAALLELPDGEAPTIEEYTSVAKDEALPLTAGQIRAAFGSWDNAKAALTGGWVPRSPAQRALRRANGGRARSHETYITALRLWLNAYQHGGTARDYDAWARSENDRLIGEGESPLPFYASIRKALPIGWNHLVRVARGELDLEAARMEQVGLDLGVPLRNVMVHEKGSE